MKKVIIIGAGINGLCSAYYLNKAGYEVQIIEKEAKEYRNCSYGNAGVIVPSHFIPLASPGMVKKGIRYMFSSSSPFYIRPRLDIDLIRWAYTFYKSCSKQNVVQGAPLLKEYNLLSKSLYKQMHQSGDFEFELKERGMLMLYKTDKQKKAELEVAEQARKLEIEAIELNAEEVQAMESNVKVNVIGGVHFTGDVNITPDEFLNNLKDYLVAKGVVFIYREEILDINTSSNGVINALKGKKASYQADEYLFTAGAWTSDLLKKIGIKLLLQGGKGYSFDMPEIDTIQTPTILCEAKVAVSPMKGFTRFSGTLEINKTDLSIQEKRVQGIIRAIHQFYPEISADHIRQNEVWSGLRPCSPDGLPYLGRDPKFSNLIVATGHAMMGMSLGPATGLLVSEIIQNKTLSLDIQKMKLRRF